MLAADEMWPVGVCFSTDRAPNRARTVAYAPYIQEILNHAGLCYATVPPERLTEVLPRLRMLVTVFDRDFGEPLKRALREWVHAGGVWIAIAGTCGLGDLLGVEALPPDHASWGGGSNNLGEGYLVRASGNHSIAAHVDKPLHFFGGLVVRPTTSQSLASSQDSHGRDSDRPALLERTVGQGRCILICPDLTGTIVHIQHGVGVTRDGVSAPDGTGPIADAVLKSGDGAVLDWIFDRDDVPGAHGLKAYLRPVADQWKELLLRAIFHGATEHHVPLPLLWLYPRKLPAIAHLSHDTDGNDPILFDKLLDTVAEAKINSTWCVILPGASAERIGRLRDAGHELAMHYDSMTEGLPWSEQQFDRQFKELTRMFGGEPIRTNKNHYLRWENDSDIWNWCEKHGIGLDQSKGASKSGEAGFNFGTCHPYFPTTFDGRIIDVLELPTPTQDLIVFAPEALLEPLLASVKKAHGVLHLLFHPAHWDKPGVPEALLTAVRRAKQEGLEWWTGRRIAEWERARRGVKWSNYQLEEDGAAVTVHAQTTLEDATLLWLDPHARGGEGTFTAWGFAFRAETTTLEAAAPFTTHAAH
ncbi:MAG TPA: hypothetical protein VGR35_16990 [Tepidisphaeraceae bacterium]|nr:hypothetical protein [Tepidisphaeraceae bacterium]